VAGGDWLVAEERMNSTGHFSVATGYWSAVLVPALSDLARNRNLA